MAIQLPLLQPAAAAAPAITRWNGNSAQAHWDITTSDNQPISMDVIYAQRTSDGKSDLIYIKVVHPQGTSEATGYAANITSFTWTPTHVSINATLTFNWTTGNLPHPITLDWVTTASPKANTITLQNGTSSYFPGTWISGNRTAVTATMTIGGSGPHPSTYTSNWAMVGATPQFPIATGIGAFAMAHWDVISTDTLISMDAYYDAYPNDNSGQTSMVWVRVIHPQGVSEVIGYEANITMGPYFTMSGFFLNTTLTFNWTNGNSPHPIALSWSATGDIVNDVITWQNGSSTVVPGDWRTATATITIGGSGPHPSTYTSNWGVYGYFRTEPSATPSDLTVTNIVAQGVALSWTNNGRQDGVKIQRSTSLDFSKNVATFTVSDQSAATYLDSSVSVNTRYYYRVQTFNAVGESGWSNTVTALVPPSAAPQYLAVTGLGKTSVTLNWVDCSNSETGFTIQRATDNTFTQNLQTFTASSNRAQMGTCTDTTATAGTTYYYRVQANSDSGNTAWSNFARAVTLP